jgi:hypothetical protein
VSVADQSCSTGEADESSADTLELMLSPEDMLKLTGAAAPEPALPRAPPIFTVRMGLAIGVALGLSAGAWSIYSFSHRPPMQARAVQAITHSAAPEPNPVIPAPAAPLPVRFANPFDASEIFEFPAGTSEAAAHQSVAELLLQRARERLPVIAKMKGRVRAGKHAAPSVTAQNSPRPRA